ncbi:1-acyl-sn-glycerol-3-phosphate acyltransferase [Caulobacter ginsengisoli]|uniref:1-acyl-sn-glycerol-3-phosphate acyltransferase n=1 Tax=Caulobacter ginsengisoli TaxID=400775 RepID=A0ABU0IX11_9CAUL|nr:lysophospholipid acyltransferase family protein [Caulobacter ginsengisoli]MDQ0465886.1 1-acyl-sn-glycerol-3-phosphate acyltransferase [Caulobacter ginsengisoli]
MIQVRSLAYLIYFYGLSVVTAFAMLPCLLGSRRGMTRAMSVYGRCVTWGLRVICGIKVEVRGLEHLPQGPVLIAAKHQCMFDIFGSFVFLEDHCYVMRKELMVIPFFGWYATKARMIVIDRKGHSAALRKLVADAKDRMQDDRRLVIFPEGTRGQPGKPGDYKPGIAALYRELDMPVLPMAVNTGVHWQKFLRVPGTIVFEFLPPIPAGLKRAEFMRELQSRIDTASDALLGL